MPHPITTVIAIIGVCTASPFLAIGIKWYFDRQDKINARHREEMRRLHLDEILDPNYNA